MRTRLNALLPIFLIVIMVTSVAMPQFSNVDQQSDEQLDETPEAFSTLGRSSPTSILAAGSGQANEDGEHIIALPNGGWVVGMSEWTNSTLTYGTHTLSPTLPTIKQDLVSFISQKWMTKVLGRDSSVLTTVSLVVAFQS